MEKRGKWLVGTLFDDGEIREAVAEPGGAPVSPLDAPNAFV